MRRMSTCADSWVDLLCNQLRNMCKLKRSTLVTIFFAYIDKFREMYKLLPPIRRRIEMAKAVPPAVRIYGFLYVHQ